MGTAPASFGKLERVLLCIPHGGLNDTLCQIERCRCYAEAFDRILVIDTHHASGIFGHFSDFFEIRDPGRVHVIHRVDDALISHLNALTCRPALLKGKIGTTYVAGYSPEKKNVCEKTNDTLLAFDRERDHEEQLLVHEQSGGGTLSTQLLPRVTFSPRMRSEISRALSKLPPRYIGVHVRNTDYRTDYIAFFESIYDKTVGKNVLVCSDDAEVISRARCFFRHSAVVTCTTVPHVAQRPLHAHSTYDSHDDCLQATTTALIDLVALGGADEFCYAKIVSGGDPIWAVEKSGFSSLAEHIARNKYLIASLLGSSETARAEATG